MQRRDDPTLSQVGYSVIAVREVNVNKSLPSACLGTSSVTKLFSTDAKIFPTAAVGNHIPECSLATTSPFHHPHHPTLPLTPSYSLSSVSLHPSFPFLSLPSVSLPPPPFPGSPSSLPPPTQTYPPSPSLSPPLYTGGREASLQ